MLRVVVVLSALGLVLGGFVASAAAIEPKRVAEREFETERLRVGATRFLFSIADYGSERAADDEWDAEMADPGRLAAEFDTRGAENVREMRMPKIGDEQYDVTLDITQDGGTYTGALVFFREGQYVVMGAAVGFFEQTAEELFAAIEAAEDRAVEGDDLSSRLPTLDDLPPEFVLVVEYEGTPTPEATPRE